MSRSVSLLAVAAITAAALFSLATTRVEERQIAEQETTCATARCSFVIF